MKRSKNNHGEGISLSTNTMKNQIQEFACKVVGGFILLGTVIGMVLYTLLGGVIHLNKREARPRE